MMTIFRVILAFIFVLFGSYAFGANTSYDASSLHGHWVLNMDETIENFKQSAMSDAEFKAFSSIMKPAEIVITETHYSGFIDGRKPTQTPYSIESVSDGGTCFKLQFKDPKISLAFQKHEVCVTNNKLLLPAIKGAKEIFYRK
jgi:hypothetical protein